MSIRLPLIFICALALFTVLVSAPSFAGNPFVGNYIGTFTATGPESGTFELTVDSNGDITGSAYDSTFNISAPFTGSLPDSGLLTSLDVPTVDPSLPVNGVFQLGSVTGTFIDGNVLGSFAGALQPAPEMNSAAAFGLIVLMASSLIAIRRCRAATPVRISD